jgi:hypothetical protein
VFWRFTTAPSFSVYRQAVTLKGDPQPGQLALTRVDRLPADAPVDTSSVKAAWPWCGSSHERPQLVGPLALIAALLTAYRCG